MTTPTSPIQARPTNGSKPSSDRPDHALSVQEIISALPVAAPVSGKSAAAGTKTKSHGKAPPAKETETKINFDIRAYLEKMKDEILEAVRAQGIARPPRQSDHPKDPCVLCHLDNHEAEGCRSYYDWLRRVARVKELGKCSRCLKQGCNELCTPPPCSECLQGLHPRFLCPKLAPCRPLKRRQPGNGMGGQPKKARPERKW